MKSSLPYLKRWVSIFFILLLLVLKCVDLHQFTHTNKAEKNCTICLLDHAQTHTDNYIPSPGIDFASIFSELLIIRPETLYQEDYSVQASFGSFLNKAPPVRA